MYHQGIANWLSSESARWAGSQAPRLLLYRNPLPPSAQAGVGPISSGWRLPLNNYPIPLTNEVEALAALLGKRIDNPGHGIPVNIESPGEETSPDGST
jgi:hypothetical protein